MAVYERNRLAAFGYWPLDRNLCDGYGLRAEIMAYKAVGSRFIRSMRTERSNEQFATEPMTWRPCTAEEVQDIRSEANALTAGDPLHSWFEPRLALKDAWLFGLIPAIPQGYLDADRATRRPLPGRLTAKRLTNLIREGVVQPGVVIHLEGRRFIDVAPDRRAIVQAIGIRRRKGIFLPQDANEREEMLREGYPVVIAAFPLHPCPHQGDATSKPWEYPMDYRFLRYQDGTLSYAATARDEWLEEQYLEAEAQGKTR